MKNIKKMAFGFWDVLKSPADDCGLFPVYTRMTVYGIILSLILYLSAARFDATELTVIVSFLVLTTFVEFLWKKVEAGKTILWHFLSLILLICSLSLLLDQSVKVRESYYRTHVLEEKIQNLVQEAPAPIIISDGLGQIKFINKMGTKLLGWSQESLKDKSLSTLMQPEIFIKHEEAFNKAANSLKNGDITWYHTNDKIVSMKKSDGSFIRVRINILGIRFSSDSESGTYLPGTDIEFYAIIEPIYSLVDLTRILGKIENNVDQRLRQNPTTRPR